MLGQSILAWVNSVCEKLHGRIVIQECETDVVVQSLQNGCDRHNARGFREVLAVLEREMNESA